MPRGSSRERRVGISRDPLRRHILVEEGVHERCVRAILQQPSHEIGQQILMRPHRRIDPHRSFAPRRLVERNAHPVQALELVVRPPRPLRHHVDRRERMRVVRRELRIDRRPSLQQSICARQIGNIRRLLGGEHRIVRLPVHLRALHFAIPVSPLHQPHHQPPVSLLRQFAQPVDHRDPTLLIGLHRQPQPCPCRQLRLTRQPLQQPKRQHQPIRLFSIER